MASFNKVNDFVKNAVHNMDLGQTIRIALSNTAPASETSNPASDGNGVIGNCRSSIHKLVISQHFNYFICAIRWYIC